MSLSPADREDRRARALLEAMPDGVGVLDPTGRLLEVNDRFCAMAGFPADEIVGRRIPFPFFPEEEIEQLTRAFEQSMRDGRGQFRLTLMRKDGERFPVTIGTTLIEEGGGVGPTLLCVVRDLTKEARERERLHEAHRVAGLASWEWDPATDRVEGSSELMRLSGIEQEQFTLDGLFSYVTAEHRGPLREALGRVLGGEQDELCHEYRVEVPSGQVEWLETRGRLLRDPSGKVLRFRATTQDVTRRKQVQLALERSEASLRMAQATAELGDFEADYRTGSVRWSRELYGLYGLDPDAPGHDVDAALKLQHPADHEAIAAMRERCIATGEPQRLLHRYFRGRELRWAETRMEPLEENGVRYGIRGTQQDVTERKRAEREIAFQAELLDVIDAAVIATDLAGTVTHWNGGAERMYGWRRGEIVGHPIARLSNGVAEDEAQIAEIRKALLATEQWEGRLEVQRKDGTQFPAYVRNALFMAPDDRPTGIVGVSVDISESVTHERRLTAARDYLRTVTDAMGQGLITVDEVGRLMYINDAGQALLGWTQEELTGQRMHELVHPVRPDGSPLAREDCPLRQVSRTGIPVRLEDEIFIRKDGTRVPVEVMSAPFETEDGIRGSVVLFSDITDRQAKERALRAQMESLTWLGRIRDALAEERFVLYAQPIVDVATGQTVQHELLIRMLDGDGTVIAPGDFLPAAEEHGLIGDIDRWVVGQALELAAAGHPVELNLSAHSIADRAVLEHFRAEFERTGADPALVVVELTETALVQDEHAAERFIERIGAMGCGLALDDFGTGYGGLSYLKRLPVDCLKIDREFIIDLPYDEASQHVVRAVVSLAKGFGQRTVAEGVEDEQTLALLREYGIDQAQGYVVARPRPVAEVFGL